MITEAGRLVSVTVRYLAVFRAWQLRPEASRILGRDIRVLLK